MFSAIVGFIKKGALFTLFFSSPTITKNSKHSSTHAQETVAQVDATIVVDVKSLFVAQTSDYKLQKPQFLAEIVHFRPDTASVAVDLKSLHVPLKKKKKSLQV